MHAGRRKDRMEISHDRIGVKQHDEYRDKWQTMLQAALDASAPTSAAEHAEEEEEEGEEQDEEMSMGEESEEEIYDEEIGKGRKIRQETERGTDMSVTAAAEQQAVNAPDADTNAVEQADAAADEAQTRADEAQPEADAEVPASRGKRTHGVVVQQKVSTAPLVVGARVDTSSLYPETPIAIVRKVRKGACTLVYPNKTEDPPRYVSWVRTHLAVYPREEAYHAIMFDGATERWLVRDDGTRAVYRITRRVLEDDLDEWILACAAANPSFWLPVEPRCFIKLQAKGAEWEGILPGGAGKGNAYGLPLPEAYVRACFSEELRRDCQAAEPRPVDCTRVGAAAVSARRSGAYLSTAVVGLASGPSTSGGDANVAGSSLVGGSRFAGCTENHCVTFGPAGALDRLGDAAAADLVAGLAAESLAQRAGTNRVKWLKHKCVQKLQRLGWTTGSVKNAQLLSKADVLAAQPGVVTVYQVKDSSKFIDHAFATVVSADGRKWLHDMNRGYVPLTAKGLDACCIGEDTTFESVVFAFTLMRSLTHESLSRCKGVAMKRDLEASAASTENACPNSPSKKARADVAPLAAKA